jgi:hypothetical protein
MLHPGFGSGLCTGSCFAGDAHAKLSAKGQIELSFRDKCSFLNHLAATE